MEPTVLRALQWLLVKNRLYKKGDRILTDPETANALIEAGSAIPYEDPPLSARAVRATAEAGLPGMSSDGDPNALVGKLTKHSRRKT